MVNVLSVMLLDFNPSDLVLIGFLAFLEALLSIDNAIVLAMMARHLPPKDQRRALTYGLVGSIVFRLGALVIAAQLIHWRWMKIAGGAYLLYISLRHLLGRSPSGGREAKNGAGFWRTIFAIELMDIAFAVDSILAAVALTPKLWIVFCGGMIGVVLMRFAATIFLKLLRRFPALEHAAYQLIFLIGAKLLVESGFGHLGKPATIGFWTLMAICLALGFRRKPS